MLFGAHMSASGGVWRALERGQSIRCDAVQLFVKNNMRWFGNPPPPEDVARFTAELSRGPLACAFGHTGYLINLGSLDSGNREKSINSLIQEIRFAEALGLPFLVLHPGAHLGAGEEIGLKQIIAGLDQVFAETKRSSVRIALENTAGQGTCLGHRLGHLAKIFEGVRTPHRLAICIDTAHLFAGGYDIRAGNGWDGAMKELASLVGLDQVVAFHLNDSKTDLGSRVDRHEHIGKGKIGIGGFQHIVNDCRFKNHPACLETPKSEDLHEDVQNLKTLRELVTIPAQARTTRKTNRGHGK